MQNTSGRRIKASSVYCNVISCNIPEISTALVKHMFTVCWNWVMEPGCFQVNRRIICVGVVLDCITLKYVSLAYIHHPFRALISPPFLFYSCMSNCWCLLLRYADCRSFWETKPKSLSGNWKVSTSRTMWVAYLENSSSYQLYTWHMYC